MKITPIQAAILIASAIASFAFAYFCIFCIDDQLSRFVILNAIAAAGAICIGLRWSPPIDAAKDRN